MFKYLKEVRKEAGKIIFPTKEELKKNTITTLVVCTGAAVFLWGISELVIKVIQVVVG